MVVIDMTNELFALLVGLNVALVVSGVAIVAHATMHSWSRVFGRFDRRFNVGRPVLVR